MGQATTVVVIQSLVENVPANRTESGRTKGRSSCLSSSSRNVQTGQRSKWHSCLCHQDSLRAKSINGLGIKRKSFRVLQIMQKVHHLYLLLMTSPQALSKQPQTITMAVKLLGRQRSLAMSLVVIAANVGGQEVNKNPQYSRARLRLDLLVRPPRHLPRITFANFLDLTSTSKPWKSSNKTSRRNASRGRMLASSLTPLHPLDSASSTHQRPQNLNLATPLTWNKHQL